MSASLVATLAPDRTRLAALRKVAIAGLLGNVVVNTVLQVVILRSLIVPLTIVLALTLVVAGVTATRWRWAPLLAALWCVFAVGPGLAPYAYNLTHPAETAEFVATLLGLGLYLVAIVAGGTATIAGERPGADGAPRWLPGFLIALAAFVLGASLVAAVPPSDAAAGVSAEALAGLPVLSSAQNKFDRTELRARVGETVALRLENRDAQRHSLDIDEMDVHAMMPSGTSALALFRPAAPGTYTFYCAIPGHRGIGMVGTLIVEP